DLVDPNVSVDQIATGFAFTEGPTWHHTERHLTFSDIPNNTQHRWSEAAGTKVLRSPSGHANGTTYGKDGLLISCEHSGRRISRMLPDGSTITLADNYEGRKLNSPNDVVGLYNGDLVFTDPPYGLGERMGIPGVQELPYCGV